MRTCSDVIRALFSARHWGEATVFRVRLPSVLCGYLKTRVAYRGSPNRLSANGKRRHDQAMLLGISRIISLPKLEDTGR